MQFSYGWNGGTISLNLGVIWEMSVDLPYKQPAQLPKMLCWADLPRALTRTKQPTRNSIKPPVPVFRLSVLVALSWLALASLTARGQEQCAAPAPVCAAQDSVFAISTPFDPLASATLIAPELLVTNRHVVADETRVEVTTADGGRLVGAVVASAFAGDLVLVRVPGLEGEPLARGVAGEGLLYAIGADDASGRVRVYAPGHRLAAPAEGKPLARLHHTARSQPGNSGGALVNENGWLVGIVAAGGEGRNDAIPASRLADLEAASGPGREAESAVLGRAYRDCIESIEAVALDALADVCRATGNRQLIDLAGQRLGRAERYDASARLYRAALEIDPDSVNSIVGLVVTLHRAERWNDEAAVLRGLIERLPADFQFLRMSVQAGKFAGDAALVDRALALIGQHHADALDAANEFLAQ